MKINRDTTIGELQGYVERVGRDRGYTSDPTVKFFKLVEEVGELAKVVGTTAGMKSDVSAKIDDIDSELADVLLVLIGLASLLDIDLAEAVAAKDAKNQNRKWT